MTKSYFNIPDQKLVREKSTFYRLEGEIVTKEKDHKIVCKHGKGIKKVIEKNGVEYEKLADHIGMMPVVMIAPDDVELINGPSLVRRRFLDSTLAQVDHHYLSDLILYNRLLKQRNALLKSGLQNRMVDPALLESYDVKMNPLADSIYKKRSIFFNQFEKILGTYYLDISGGGEHISCSYASHLDQSSLLELAASNRDREKMMGRTLFGIHKDSIVFSLENHPMKLFASQGQKKSFIFALKLAQFQYLANHLNEKPMLLLDDIFDRLDLDRVDRLAGIILKPTFGQVFVSDTQKERMHNLVIDKSREYETFLINKQKHTNEEE